MQSPGGAAKLSPALQRGVEWNDDASPGGTTDDLTHTLQRCGNCSVLSSVSDAARKLKAYHERMPASSELPQERGERVHCQVAGMGGGLRQAPDFAN